MAVAIAREQETKNPKKHTRCSGATTLSTALVGNWGRTAFVSDVRQIFKDISILKQYCMWKNFSVNRGKRVQLNEQ
jgi:hypothetical protein